MLVSYTTLSEQLEKYYTLFTLNRKYRATQWKDDPNAYVAEQQKVASKISELSREVEKKIRADIKKTWADAEVLAYDSRTFNIASSTLGSVLLKGLKKESDCLDLQAVFLSTTGYKVIATRAEDLDKKTLEEVLKTAEEDQKKAEGEKKDES